MPDNLSISTDEMVETLSQRNVSPTDVMRDVVSEVERDIVDADEQVFT